MPTFILTGRFTQSAIKGLVAKPEDRSGVIAIPAEAAGAQMLAYYVITGDTDFMVISEFPDMEAAASAVMVAAASEAISDTETRQAWSYGEFAEIAKKAGGIGGAYNPPG